MVTKAYSGAVLLASKEPTHVAIKTSQLFTKKGLTADTPSALDLRPQYVY
jgi:hypothetical protein